MRSNQKIRTKKASRIARLKKRRLKKRLTFIISIAFVLSILCFSAWQLYMKNKCKDLDFAVEHYLTSGNDEDKLLRVQNISLIFSDDNTAVVKAYGLSKATPHSESTVEGHFRKGSSSSWTLESSNLLKNTN